MMSLDDAIVMEPRSLDYVQRACQARWSGNLSSAMIHGVSTDSRKVRAGDLFVALPGVRFDGHDFIPNALAGGANALLVQEPWRPSSPLPCPALVSENSRSALGKLAGCYRDDFDLPVIAVAGSNGKTSTKDMLAAVLAARWNTLASEASYNNDVGVPLTLLRLQHQHEAAVLEAGTNHPGELAPLVRMIRPQIGVMTGVGREHLEFFGDMDGVVREEGFLPELLPEDGWLFINGDSPRLEALEARSLASVTRVGLREHNHWRAKDILVDERGTRFDVAAPEADYRGYYRIQALGIHQVRNALLALAVAARLNVPAAQAREALAACAPSKMRMHLWSVEGVRVLDDSYNANLDSMIAAFETMRGLAVRGRRIAALGDMAELGEYSIGSHEEAGRLAASSGVELLMLTGQWAEHTAQGAREGGCPDVRVFATAPQMAETLRSAMRAGDLILLKASRSSGFERVAAVLQGKTQA